MNPRYCITVVLTALGMATAVRGHQTAPAPRVIHIFAERFSFTPANVTVDEGASVEIRLSSEDTAHGFRLIGPGDINVEIPKRGRGDVRVPLDTSRPGTYTFECSKVCGAGHGFMRGTVQVKAREKAAGIQ